MEDSFMRTKLSILSVGLAIALIVGGCNKKSSNPATSPQTSTTPTFPVVSIKGPNTNSTDTYAQTVKAYATSVSQLTTPSFLGAIITVSPTQSGNTWTWAGTEGNFTVTATATQQTDGSLTWSATLNGTDPSSGTTYNNFVAMTGSSSADGKSGDFKSYVDNTTTLDGDFAWSTNASGALTATLQSYTNGSVTNKITIVNSSDGSGELDAYSGTVLTFKATWVANGSGTWWTYDSGTGTQTGTGTWS